MKQDLRQIFELKNASFRQPFPVGLAGEEIEGIELVLLAADCSGLVDKFLGRKGTKGKLEQKDYQLLKELRKELSTVIPHLSDTEKPFFKELEELVDQTLTYIEQTLD
jgi:hypothetical protein